MFHRVLAHTSFVGSTGYNNHARSFFTKLNDIIPVKVRNFTVGSSWEGLNQEPHNKEPYITDAHKGMLIKLKRCVINTPWLIKKSCSL